MLWSWLRHYRLTVSQPVSPTLMLLAEGAIRNSLCRQLIDVNLYEKFQEKMNDDINRTHGGFFSSYGQAFSSLGLSGPKYKWCLLLSK